MTKIFSLFFKNLNPSFFQFFPKHFTLWKSYAITVITLPLNGLVTATAFCLYPIMARCVVFSSSKKFKKTCCPIRIKKSIEILKTVGGKEATLKHPFGHTIQCMYFNFEHCLKHLQDLGCVIEHITLPDQKIQKTLSLPNQELVAVMEKMGISVLSEKDKNYIALGLPIKSEELNNQKNEPGTMIYAPGSGHIFEFRRKTIQQFLFGFGMNVLVLHYTGTGNSRGKISEDATYGDMETCYQYLTNDLHIKPNKILGYGHCMGGGPITNLASKYPINLFVDRTVEIMSKFARLRVKTVCRIPDCLNFLVNWVVPVMDKGFKYDNATKIEKVKGFVAVASAKDDHMIPPSYMKTLYGNATSASKKILFQMAGGHDEDFGTDKKANEILGQFLKQANLI